MMAKAYSEEIVNTTTQDGLVLDGVVIRPTAGVSRPVAVIWVHGLMGKFYSPTQLGVGRALAAEGHTSVSGNNRGNHFGASMRRTNGESALAGGGWEHIDESPYDVDAWITFAGTLGFERVVVIGHSFGALKAVQYQSLRQDPRVAGLALASTARPTAGQNPTFLVLAEQMVAEGRGQDLLPWGSSRADVGAVSAASLLSRVRAGLYQYGIDAPDPAIATIRCPILATFGTVRDSGTEADLEMIRRKATMAERIDTATVEGADHFYTGQEAAVASVISNWMQQIA
jgi:pimeloyl-ACP methyl ester carboxylesterase